MNTIVKLSTLQAFVITKHLQTMGGEGRVMVVRFGYSSIKTIPQVVTHISIQFLYISYEYICRRFLTISSRPATSFPSR